MKIVEELRNLFFLSSSNCLTHYIKMDYMGLLEFYIITLAL